MLWLRAATICVALTMLPVTTSWSGENRVQTQLSSRYEHDDNLTQLVGDTISTGKWITNLSGKWNHQTPRLSLDLRGLITDRNHLDARRFDSTDVDIASTLNWQGQRLGYSVEVSVSEDTSLTSEVDTSGLVGSGVDRQSWRFSPQLNYRINQRWQLLFSSFATDVDYDTGSGLQDYDYNAVQAGVTFELKPRQQISAFLSRSDYQAQLSGLQTSSDSLLLGWNYQLNEVWSTRVSAGLETTKIEQPTFSTGAESRLHGESVDISLGRVGERSQQHFSASRSLVPSGSGILLTRDDLKLESRTQLTEKISVVGSIRQLTTENFSTQNQLSERTYREIDLALNWQWNRYWAARMRVINATQERDTDTNESRRNRISLSISFSPEARRLAH